VQKKRRLEDKENQLPHAGVDGIEEQEEDDELSMIKTPMMQVGSAGRRNSQTQMVFMTDDRIEESADELG